MLMMHTQPPRDRWAVRMSIRPIRISRPKGGICVRTLSIVDNSRPRFVVTDWQVRQRPIQTAHGVATSGRLSLEARGRPSMPQVVRNRGDCVPPSQKRGEPYIHIYDMGLRMKTTLNIDDTVMAELKREAARQGRTMSELVETALRLLLSSQRKRGKTPALPRFHSGGALVDVADRDALYHAMECR